MNNDRTTADTASMGNLYQTAIFGHFRELVQIRRQLGFKYAGIAIIVYVSFFCLVAFKPSTLVASMPYFGSVGFFLMFLMFAIAWSLAWLYQRAATHLLVPLEAQARSEMSITGVQGEV